MKQAYTITVVAAMLESELQELLERFGIEVLDVRAGSATGVVWPIGQERRSEQEERPFAS